MKNKSKNDEIKNLNICENCAKYGQTGNKKFCIKTTGSVCIGDVMKKYGTKI